MTCENRPCFGLYGCVEDTSYPCRRRSLADMTRDLQELLETQHPFDPTAFAGRDIEQRKRARREARSE
jgi:hypothetical protein